MRGCGHSCSAHGLRVRSGKGSRRSVLDQLLQSRELELESFGEVIMDWIRDSWSGGAKRKMQLHCGTILQRSSPLSRSNFLVEISALHVSRDLSPGERVAVNVSREKTYHYPSAVSLSQ